MSLDYFEWTLPVNADPGMFDEFGLLIWSRPGQVRVALSGILLEQLHSAGDRNLNSADWTSAEGVDYASPKMMTGFADLDGCLAREGVNFA